MVATCLLPKRSNNSSVFKNYALNCNFCGVSSSLWNSHSKTPPFAAETAENSSQVSQPRILCQSLFQPQKYLSRTRISTMAHPKPYIFNPSQRAQTQEDSRTTNQRAKTKVCRTWQKGARPHFNCFPLEHNFASWQT